MKLKERLIYRQFLFGPYAPTTNVFTGGKLVDYSGAVCPLAQIQLQDQATQVTIVPANNPNQNPQTWKTPGVNTIAPIRSYDGFRRGQWISMTGMSIEIRSAITALSAVAAPLYDSAQLHYRVFMAMWPDSDLTDARPDLEDLGQFVHRFGHTKKLDLVEFEETKNFKIRYLFKGELNMRCNTLNSDVKFRRHYITFPKPLKVEYLAAEQNGRRIVRWKPFIAFQSDIPAGAGYDAYKPLIHCVTKLHYYDT